MPLNDANDYLQADTSAELEQAWRNARPILEAIPELYTTQHLAPTAPIRGDVQAWYRAVEQFGDRPQGDRHSHLLRLGRTAGGLSEILTEDEARKALQNACTKNGYIRDDGQRKFEADFADGWKNGLLEPLELGVPWPVLNKQGHPDKHRPDNVQAFLDYKGHQVRWNEFTGRVEIDSKEFTENILIDLWAEARRLGSSDDKGPFADLIRAIAQQNPRHPVREYLEGLTWDKTPRMKHWLYRHCGSEKTALNCWFAGATLMGAVHRVMNPGCKFDLMLVLEGRQGAGKSTIAAILGGDWFTDSVKLGDDSKVMIEQTAGKWIVEVAELSGMSNKEVEHIKSQISRQSDRARLAYAHEPSEVPRQFILIGTTNDDRYLKDKTGNRRFMPVKVGTIDLEALRAERDQLWAEAYWRYQRGLPANCIPEDMWSEAAEAQAARLLEDPVQELLEEWFSEQTGVVEKRCIRQALDSDGFRPSQALDNNITRIMTALEWQSSRRRRDERNPRVYLKEPAAQWLVWDDEKRSWKPEAIRLDIAKGVE
jgi:predicted P-loop ATPase